MEIDAPFFTVAFDLSSYKEFTGRNVHNCTLKSVPGGDSSFEGIMKKLPLAFVAVVAIMLDFTLADPMEEDKDIEVRNNQTN